MSSTGPSLERLPDGGWKAWTQVIAAFFIFFCTMGLGNSFGVFQFYYEQHLLAASSPSDIAWIGTTQGFLMSVVSILSGALYDRGYIRSVLYVGAACIVLGFLATSFMTQYPGIFLCFGVLIGFGSGLLYVPGLAIASAYFTTKIPLATGIATSGASIGGIAYSILFPRLVNLVGFPWTCRALAIGDAFLLLITCLLIRPHRVQGPSHESLAAISGRSSQRSSKAKLFQFQTLRGWPFLLFCICLFMLHIGIDVPFFFLPSFARERLSLSYQLGDYLLAAMNGSTLFGRLALGYTAVHMGALRVFTFSVFGACLLLAWWATVNTLLGIVVLVVLYGFFIGGVMTLISPSLQVITLDPETLGARLGIAEGFMGVGFLIGPPIAGAILMTPAGYTGVSAFTGSLYLLVLVALVFYI